MPLWQPGTSRLSRTTPVALTGVYTARFGIELAVCLWWEALSSSDVVNARRTRLADSRASDYSSAFRCRARQRISKRFPR